MSRLYGDAVGSAHGGGGDGDDDDDDGDEDGDIETAISAEIGVIKTTKSTGLFKVIRPDITCGKSYVFVPCVSDDGGRSS